MQSVAPVMQRVWVTVPPGPSQPRFSFIRGLLATVEGTGGAGFPGPREQNSGLRGSWSASACHERPTCRALRAAGIALAAGPQGGAGAPPLHPAKSTGSCGVFKAVWFLDGFQLSVPYQKCHRAGRDHRKSHRVVWPLGVSSARAPTRAPRGREPLRAGFVC